MTPIEKNHVHVTGNPAGRTLVLVHGIGTDQTAWAAVAGALADEHRIVLLDNVGAGGADARAGLDHRYLGLEGYADDVVAVLAHLGIRDAVVVGHSIGAMIAALATFKAPSRITALVLVAASPRYLDDEGYPGGLRREDIDGIYAAATSDFERWADRFATNVTGESSGSAMAREFASHLAQVPRQHLLTVLCSALQTDHRRQVAEIRVPTLIVQSREDPFVPRAIAEYLNDRIAGSRLAVVDANGHLPHVSRPDLIVEQIRAFVAGLPSR